MCNSYKYSNWHISQEEDSQNMSVALACKTFYNAVHESNDDTDPVDSGSLL